MIKAIIFDFGGVVLKHKASLIEDILTEIFPHNSDIAKKVWMEYRQLLSTGKKTSDDFVLELKGNIDTDQTTTELKQKWMELYKRYADNVDWELLDFIQKLKGKYKVYLFTDTIDIHDEYNKTRNIYDKFHEAYKSFEEGVAKVEGKSAFLYLLKKIQAQPSECIFVDDLEKNVKIAEELGMKGILYTDLEKLKNQIVQANVNP